MVRQKKLSKYLIVSGLVHILLALAMSVIYAEQPRAYRRLEIKAVRIRYEKPEPPPPKPKPKVVTKAQPKKVTPKKQEPKVTPKKVTPPKVTQRRRPTNAPAPGLALEKAPERSRSEPGTPGLTGKRGAPGDRPGMRASGGISHPTLTTKTGGSGLSPGLTHGSMKVPAGSSQLPGAGGREVAGFRVGASQTGDGVGQIDIAGRGGGGGNRGRSTEGPGAGLSSVGSRTKLGGGQGTTGLGVGTTEGMGEVESEPGGGGPGGGGGGPGSGGYNPVESRSGPNLAGAAGVKTDSGKESPGKRDIPEEKRAGATGKKEFKADVAKSMTNVTQALDKTVSGGFQDALQGEINKHLYSLRKMYEDWQNLKIPNVPKALQITIELTMEKGKPKLMKADFHNAALAARIRDDLTKKIKEWKFESLYDGKDDPEKWPIKLTGKISWQ